MSHDDFAFETAPGLPAPLPVGEQLLWQGSPDWRALAIRAYHVRKVALYFAALALWRVLYGATQSDALHDILVSCALLTVLGGIAVAVLSTLAYLSSRATVYSVTTRRVLLRHGIAVPMTMNVPFKMIDGAALKVFANGNGDIALTVPKDQRVGYLITWPHLRPGYITRPQPSLRALPDAERAAAILSDALARDAATEAATADSLGAARPRTLEPVPTASSGRRTLGPRPAAVA